MKTFFKFLQRNKLYTAIEAFGLAVALGFVILLGSYARTEYTVGRTSPSYDSIYAIGASDFVGMTMGTGKHILARIPSIASWTRLCRLGSQDVQVGDQYYQVKASAVDADFFAYMSMPLLRGNTRQALRDAESVVLSESFAVKAFGTADAVGKTLTWQKDKEHRLRLRVTGVMPDQDASSILMPQDMLLPIAQAQDMVAEMDNFGSVYTFVRLAPGASPTQVERDLLKGYKGYWDWWKDDGSDGAFLYGSSLTPVSGLYFSSIEKYDPFRSGNRAMVLTLVVVALVLLLSALINYVNLTVAQTGRRAREMATRQLVGETRWSVLRRYMAESLLFTAFCSLLGFLVAFAFRPLFDDWLTASIKFPTDALSIAVALAGIVLVSLLAAIVPALLVLRIKPIDVVRGDFRFRSKMVLGRVFMVVQSAISMVLVSAGLCMTLQMRHMLNRPTGYRTGGIITLRTWALGLDKERQQMLRDRLASLPQVRRVGMAASVPWACGHDGVHREGEKQSWMRRVRIDSVTFSILGFRVVDQYTQPLPGMEFVTEETRRRYNVSRQNPYVETAREGQEATRVCGVIADYNVNSAMDNPMDDSHNCLKLIPQDYDYIFNMVIEAQGDPADALVAVNKTYTSTAQELTGLPLEGNAEYVQDYLRKELSGTHNTMMLVLVFMFISILISALGLLAMSVYFAAQQGRQIALRRVFGYGKWAVVGWLSLRYVLTTLVAIVLATPVSVWLMRRYLQDFHYAIPFPWYVLPVAALVTLLVAILSILWQTWRAASANPVETLRSNE